MVKGIDLSDLILKLLFFDTKTPYYWLSGCKNHSRSEKPQTNKTTNQATFTTIIVQFKYHFV